MARDAILLAFDGPAAAEWAAELRSHAAGRDIRVWADTTSNLADVAIACVWRPPQGLLKRCSNLRAIINLGAGVDWLMSDPSTPDVPIARVVHPNLTSQLVEYVVLHTLMHHRRQRLYDTQQRERRWQVHDQPAAAEVAVGVMGLGAIGAAAAQALARLGYQVAGWSRTPKAISGIQNFHGKAQLDAFLARTEILACLLAQTPQTERLLNHSLFRKLKRDGAAGGAFLINAARGGLQVDADIVAALNDGTLAGATLDVFPQEPLPADSPLWPHPKVTITPHHAGDISPRAYVRELMAQIERVERGQPLANLIDRKRGY
jgi:glyoxylate/hydroxypyruvate reductase A